MKWGISTKLSLVALIAFLFLAGSGCVKKQSTKNSIDTHLGEPYERIKRVENGLLPPVVVEGKKVQTMNLLDRMKRYNVPGLSIAVIDNYQIAWAKGYGVLDHGGDRQVTPQTRFQAASISKPLAAWGALVLAEKGVLNLDTDVSKQLESWKIPDNEYTKDEKITLRRLINHNAGLTVDGFNGYEPTEKLPTLVQVLKGEKPANSAPVVVDTMPGEIWRYSSGGYCIMQQLMIDVTQKPFYQIMKETVLDPLGMKRSDYRQPPLAEMMKEFPTGHLAKYEKVEGRFLVYPEMSAAGLWTTPSDLALAAIELMNAASGRPSRLLSKELAKQMLTEKFDGYGLGIFVQGEGKSLHFSHPGTNAGFRAQMVGYPQRGKGVVIMTNSIFGAFHLMCEIARSVAREYNWPDFQPETIAENPLTRDELAAYAGRFKLDAGGSVDVVVENGRMYLKSEHEEPAELIPAGEERFVGVEQSVEVVFDKDTKGKVTGLTIDPRKFYWVKGPKNQFLNRAKRMTH